MKIETLISKQDAIDKGFEMHRIYDYPIICLKCNKNVRINKDTEGLFQCNCRFIILNYPCGVYIN
jgi:hypothetical protein